MSSQLLKNNSAKTVAKIDAKDTEAPGLSGDKKTMDIVYKLFKKYGAEYQLTPEGQPVKCGENYTLSLKKMAKNAAQGK